MPLIDLKGLHRVRKTLACGKVAEYHYAYRGGPKFWDSNAAFKLGTPDYFEAFIEASKPHLLQAATRRPNGKTTADVIRRFRASVHYMDRKPRTKQDYDKYLNAFEAGFSEDPIKLFEEPEAVAEIRQWKEQWAHSPKQYDYATTVVTQLLNWAKEEDHAITVHHHVNVKRVYKSDRSQIIWLPEETGALLNIANEREARVVIAASEGGLTPQDIGILTRKHVQKTPQGRRLYFKRTKNGKAVSIPVTPAMAGLIDTTPEGQTHLVVSLEGRQLQPERASGIIRDLKARVNAAAGSDPKAITIRDGLRLYDMRGTAATELLRAGCSLNEIAVTMGWGLRHAGNIIEKYAATVPEVADEVLAKLTIARQKKLQKP